MARGGASHARPSFHPPNDPATYRDLLFFEERLKTNAASLQRRKSRYQLFLFHLVLVIAFLLSEVLLQTSFLDIPCTFVLRRTLPDVHGRIVSVKPHPYFTSGLLFVAITTLLLFFASGMYSEKIAYANRYVPHANKALRSLNMYLNVRKPPLRSKFSLNPMALLFPRPEPSPEPIHRSMTRFPSPSTTDRSTSVPIAPIPPAANPRGELIFSSRVDRSFRESYERYRAAFERKRQERERSDAMQTWWGWLRYQMPWNKRNVVLLHTVAAATTPQARTAASSTRGRGAASVFPTPSSSRRSSPVTRASRRGTPAGTVETLMRGGLDSSRRIKDTGLTLYRTASDSTLFSTRFNGNVTIMVGSGGSLLLQEQGNGLAAQAYHLMPFSHHSHSGQFCRHASGTLEEVVLEAIRQGFEVYGLTEHVPRYRLADLYPEEAGLSPDSLIKQFADFLNEAHRLKSAYASQITILVGLETEFITDTDLENLSTLLSEQSDRVEYIVGSIHHVNAIPIDLDHASFERALHSCPVTTDVVVAEMNATTARGRMDDFLSTYFDAHYRLLERFRPEIIGHLDLCRLYDPELRFSEFPNAWDKLRRNVLFAIGYGALFEVNAAAVRKGWKTCYPGKDVAALILELGGRLVLSDDSHGPHRVGENYSHMRSYLRQLGVKELWYLTRTPDGTPFQRGLFATRVAGNWWEHDYWRRCAPSG